MSKRYMWFGNFEPYDWFCSAEGEEDATGASEKAVEKPADTPAPASSAAAQAALADSDKKPTLLTEEKPAEKTAEIYNSEKLAIPDGFEIPKERLESFGKIVEGLPHDRAQALVNLYADIQRTDSQKSFDFWKTTRDGWEAEARGWTDDEVKNAKFIAGEKTLTGLDAMIQTVAKVLDNPQLTDPKFREALEFTGIGSHPAAVRTLYRWASQLIEGGPTPIGKEPPGRGDKDDDSANRSAAQILYPGLAKG